MKKLWLFLLTLLIPVMASATDYYLKLYAVETGGSETDIKCVDGAPHTFENVKIGSGNFRIRIWGGEEWNNNYINVSGGTITQNVVTSFTKGGTSETNIKIAGASTGDCFNVIFDLANMTIKVEPVNGSGGGDDDDDYTAYSFYLNYPHASGFNCGTSGHTDWGAHTESLDADGKYTYSGIRLSSGGFNFYLLKNGTPIKFFNDQTNVTVGEPLSLNNTSGSRDYCIISDFDSTKSYDFTVDYKNKTFVITEHSDTPVEKTYTVKYNNGKTAWDAVWAYAVDNSNNAIEASKQLTEVTDGIYTYSFTTTATPSKVYFSDSEITDTASLTGYDFENGKTYGEGTVDYSSYKVKIRYDGHWDSDWIEQNLNADGTYSVELALGENAGFNFSVLNGSETINYTGNTTVSLNSPITLSAGTAEAYFKTTDSRYDQSKNTTIKFDFVNNKLTLEQEVPAEPTVPTVYFICPSEWTAPKIFMYNNNYNGEVVNSGDFDALAMTQEATELAGLVDLATGEKILKYSPSAEDMEKFTGVIFNNAGSSNQQTRNLVLVDHAIYRVTNVMLPSMKYFPEAEANKDKVQVYSTTDNVVEYNSIYLSFANPPQETATESDENEFFNYNKSKVGAPAGKRIGVDIYVGGTEESNRVTGVRGTMWMYEREIAGKKFFRVDFPEYLIPDGTTLSKITFYEIDYNASDDSADKFPKVSSSVDDMKKPGYSITYENVKYTNGRVFYRPPMADDPVHVATLFTPDYLWLVAKNHADGTEGFIEYTDNQGKKQRYVAGTDNDRVLLMPSENANGKITYNLHNVNKESSFNLAGQFVDGAGKPIYYAFSGDEAEFMMLPNNDYPLVTSQPKTTTENITDYHFLVNLSNFPALDLCDITVRWADQMIFVSPVKVTAGFSYYSSPELEGDNDPATSHRRINAIANNSDKPAYVYIKHNENFGTNVNHYNATSTNIVVRPAYEDYITGLNKKATVGKLTSATTEAGTAGMSKVAVYAHTAGIYSLYVAQTSTLDEFHTTSIRIPVRVSPTLQSIRLVLNGNYGIYEEDGVLTCSPKYDEVYEETTAGGNTIKWDANRVKFDAFEAEPGDGLEIWFADADVIAANQVNARSVVRREASDIVPEEETNEIPAGYTKYGMNNTLKLVNEKGEPKSQNISFIVKQNGIIGAPQTVAVNATDKNIATAVDEIEAAAAEAVYYNLNGIRVDAENLQPGIYVVVKGTEVSKVLVR